MEAVVPLRARARPRRRGPSLAARLAGATRAAGLGALSPALLDALGAAAEARGLGAALPGDVYQELLARDGRRAAGVYYTPPALVALALDRGLGPALAAAPGAAPRVLDPACGAGAFLTAALDRLAEAAVAAGARPGAALRVRLAARLTGIDRDPVAADLARLALALAIGGEAALERPALLAAAARRIVVADALAAPPPPADVVVGNPPWGKKGYALPPAELAHLRATFATCARGALDPFVPFVELAVRALPDGGRLALILPDVVLLKDHAPVRTLLLDETALELVAHAGRAFPGVNLDAVVLVARRGRPPRGHAVEAWRTVPPDRPRRIPQRVFAGLPGKVLNLHLDAGARAALAALAPLPRLGDAFEIHEGVHSGNARARLFVAARPAHGARLIVGKGELARFRLRWAGRWLDRDPAALDRAAGGYANLGRAAWFDGPKIVVRRTGDRVIAAHDPDGFHVSNNLFVVVPRAARDRDPARLAAITALLNSRFMTAYFRTIVPRVGRLFAELKIHHLAGFPLPPPAALARRRAALARLADALADDGLADDARRALEDALDDEVESLYPKSRDLVAAARMRP